MAARAPRPGKGGVRKPELRWIRVDGGLLPDCVECSAKLSEPFLVEAAASVGIDHNIDTGAVLRGLLTSYHRSGHTTM